MRFTTHSETEKKTAAVEERPSMKADVAKNSPGGKKVRVMAVEANT